MKKFIFYTGEGYTFSPLSEDENNPDVENFQVLGIEEGRTAKSAFNKLIKLNKWIKELGYNEVISEEIVGNVESFYVED